MKHAKKNKIDLKKKEQEDSFYKHLPELNSQFKKNQKMQRLIMNESGDSQTNMNNDNHMNESERLHKYDTYLRRPWVDMIMRDILQF